MAQDKILNVTEMILSRLTIEEGQFVDVTMVVESSATDRTYKGDLVLEVDGSTVWTKQDIYIADDNSFTVPVKIAEPGSHNICATVINVEASQYAI